MNRTHRIALVFMIAFMFWALEAEGWLVNFWWFLSSIAAGVFITVKDESES